MKLAPLILALLCGSVGVLSAQTYTFSTVTTAVYSPAGLVVDPSGAIYVTGSFDASVYKLSATGAVVAQYGSIGGNGSADGTATNARFYYPHGLALDAAGNLFVADTSNHTIRKITPAGTVSTIAGSAGLFGTTDGIGSAARFYYPQGIAVDSAGNLFVSDTNNHTIRKITPAGVVSTFAGSPGSAGGADGAGSAARFYNPQGLAIDSAGNLFVADTGNSTIRQITPAGAVTTLAGSALNWGIADGPATLARFDGPQGVAVDAAGTVYVADAGNYTIRRITAGSVTTLGGLAGNSNDLPGVGSTARFWGPHNLAVAASGDLFVADSRYLKIGTRSSQLAITVQPQSLTVGVGSAAVFSVSATGATPITYQWQKNGTAIAGATGATLTIPTVQASDVATYTVTVNNSVGTLASTGAVLTVVAAVPNDNFANAQVITGSSGTVSGTNNGATGEPGEPTHGSYIATGSSVWYKWTATDTGTAVFSNSIGGSSISFYMGAWIGNSVNALTPAASPGGRLSFHTQSGTTYYLAVGSVYSSSRGNFSFSWRMLFNDDFANAQTLTGSSGFVGGDNGGATGETGEPIHYSQSGTNTSVWYRWTPAQSGTATFDGAASLFDVVVAAYTGSSVSALTQLAQDHLSVSNVALLFRSRIVFNVTAGVTYSIAVGSGGYGTGSFGLTWQTTPLPVIVSQPAISSSSITGNSTSATASVGQSAFLTLGTVVSFTPVSYQWNRNGTAIAGATSSGYAIASAQVSDTGSYTVTVTNAAGSVTSAAATLAVLVPPPNDNFANAQSVTGLTGSVTGTNVNATGEPGEPTHWNLSGTATSVWYQWTAPASGLAGVDTVGSNFDTVMAVYTGASLTSLARLVQDDDSGGSRTSLVNFAATSGTTYYIAIGGNYSNTRGSIRLNYRLSPTLAVTTPPVNQTVVVGGAATFSVVATGTAVTYQWNRNGVAIPGATNPTLTVSNTQGGADASYTATVTNSTGSVTSAPATLTVAAPALTNLSIRNTRAGGGLLWGIAAGGGTLVAVGDGGAIISSLDNGLTWAPRVSGTANWIVGVTYGNGQFVAVADHGLILLSPDGATWTPAASSGTAQRINNVIYADGKFVAVGEAGTILTSTDANVWTPRVSGITAWLHGLAYNAGVKTFATSGQGGVFLFSSDGATWTSLPITGLTTDLEATVAVDSYAHFVSIGADGVEVSVRQNQTILKTGDTLTTWSATTSQTGSDVRFRGLVQGASALFATGEGGKVVTASSDAGPWFTLPSGTTGNLLAGIFYNNELFIVGENETVIQSDPLYTSRLINISTRGQVGTGANIMISGFVVTGTVPKPVLVRAVGPTLGAAPFNVPGTLAAPVLTLVDAQGKTVATSTGWSTATNAAAIATTTARVGAFPLAAGSADAAVLATVNPGSYTALITGANDTTGLVLVEAYDADSLSNDTSRAINISTRGLVGTDANTLIAGFVIDGASSRRVLIRAVGPGLGAFGLTGTLAQPQIALYNSKGLLTSTAGAWGLQANADEIRGAIDAVGAFRLTDGSNDSAMVVTLLPGAWTVQVSGANGATGLAIVEVYALP